MLISKTTPPNLSLTDTVKHPDNSTFESKLWEEYSSFHDSFTEQLAYENSRRLRSDAWHLHYI